MEKLYKFEEVAEILGLSEKTVRAYVQHGKIDHVKLTGTGKYSRVRFTKENIDSFINKSTVKAKRD